MENWKPLGALDEFKYLANSLGDASWRAPAREPPNDLPPPTETEPMVSPSNDSGKSASNIPEGQPKEETTTSRELPELSQPQSGPSHSRKTILIPTAIAAALLITGALIFIKGGEVVEERSPQAPPLALDTPAPQKTPPLPKQSPQKETPPAPELPVTQAPPPTPLPQQTNAAPPGRETKATPAPQKERDNKKIGTLQKANPLPPRVQKKRPVQGDDLLTDLFGDTRKQESKMALQQPEAIQSAHLPEGLTAESVLDVISNNSLSIKLCLDQAMRKGEKPKGRLDIKVTIAPTGAVQDVAITTPRFNHSTMARCTKKRIRQWRFPPFEGDPIPVEFPYVLSAGF